MGMRVKQIPRGNDRKKSKGKSESKCKGKRERATPGASPVWFGEAWELAGAGLAGGEGIAFGELDLMPVRVGEGEGAGFV